MFVVCHDDSICEVIEYNWILAGKYAICGQKSDKKHETCILWDEALQ